MADVSEDMGTDDLQSLKFLLSNTLPRERMDRAKVRGYHVQVHHVLSVGTGIQGSV